MVMHPRWALLRELVSLRDSARHLQGLPPIGTLRVAGTGAWGQPGSRRGAADIQYGLRAILPCEIVFDVGDHLEHDWPEVRRRTHALWDELNDCNLAYLGAPSGGRGTHTHLFYDAPDDHDHRPQAATIILENVNERLGGWELDLDVADPVCISPRDGSQLVREFGVSKTNRKTLWTTGPGPYEPLPLDREAAYAGETIVPSTVPVNRYLPGMYNEVVRVALGGPCPTEPDCYTQPDYCTSCPISR